MGDSVSKVWRTTMNLDEPLAKAFETIREVACFDSHSLVQTLRT